MVNWGKKDVISVWLLTGIVMVMVQIVLGAITRLTGSGLSITRWDIVTGVLFPLSDESWNVHFNLYKQTPQFQKINSDFTLDNFKFIFFWEWFHRLWARLMGIIFVIPLVYFVFKKKVSRRLGINLILVFLAAVFVATLGWIMVASGLVNYPWVNAYKLSFHFLAAILLLSVLVHTFINYNWNGEFYFKAFKALGFFYFAFCVLIIVQLFLGAVMSGMKAGLVAPTWPKLNQDWIPIQLYSLMGFDARDYIGYYEQSHVPLLVQFIHRCMAYVLYFFSFILLFKYWRRYRVFFMCLTALVSIQVLLGILTVINCVGGIPLYFAVGHQLIGIVFWCTAFPGLYFLDSKNKNLGT
ncbi:MAG TPA: COX15/CtaA family protein [Saprospiraceae bacterium]|nr:COX15/CtaA family protein [Saprospiraceae bacterium]